MIRVPSKKVNHSLEELGEFNIIKKIDQLFSTPLPKGVHGIGDDCAVLEQPDGTSLLVTTDLLAEGIHFLYEKTDPSDLGYKSLAVNLSDIAAMGGTPLYALLSFALPKKTPQGWLDSFLKGFKELAVKENVYLIGGDTSTSVNEIFINITLIGQAHTEHIKYRSMALPDDMICCTHPLGDSHAGLKLILNDFVSSDEFKSLIEAHYRPQPCLKIGQWLAKQPAVHAMIDISDGVDSDLQRIIEQSGCGAEIYIEQVPLSQALLDCAKKHSWNPVEMALTGGEDYSLLFTVDPEGYEALIKNFKKEFNSHFFKIGKIVPKEAGLKYQHYGDQVTFSRQGYDHFKTVETW